MSKLLKSTFIWGFTKFIFDDKSIIQAIKEAIKYRDELKSKVKIAENHPSINWNGKNDEDFNAKAKEVGTLTYDSNEDIRGLKQYVLFGIKWLFHLLYRYVRHLSLQNRLSVRVGVQELIT